MNEKRERRLLGDALKVELRAEGDAAPRTLVGHAALFETPYDIGDVKTWGFREVIAPGAFAAALAEQQDVRALWNHDEGAVLGRTRAGTLRLVEDVRGLAVEIDVPDTQVGRDVAELVRRGDVSQMSFAFAVRDEAWSIGDDGIETRRITRVDLFDVSPVTYPANANTEIALRDATARVLEERQRAASGASQMRLRQLALLGLE